MGFPGFYSTIIRAHHKIDYCIYLITQAKGGARSYLRIIYGYHIVKEEVTGFEWFGYYKVGC